jgi:hypothetical protein
MTSSSLGYYLTRAVADLLGLATAGASVIEHTGVVGVSADVFQSTGIAIV